MGTCVSLSIPLDHSVNKISQWVEKKSGYIYNPKKNLVALDTNMGELKAKWGDLSRRLKREEDRGRKRLAEFQVWLNSVETIETEVNDILTDRNVQSQRLCLCGFCCKNLRSRYRYGKTVFLKLREVEKLKNKDFKVITEDSYEHEVEERQLPRPILGQDILLDRAWKHLMKDEVGIIGLYGLGGVGKTTLLSQINNKFCEDKYGFDFVIWISVSKELHIEKIQDEIAEKLGLGGEEWNPKGKSQKTSKLFNFLKKKKFVLFLDSIWEKVEFTEIGVPFPTTQNKCKVAFTTHSRDVCSCMGVEDPIKVQCLEENDAFDLFKMKVGQITLESEPEIPDLARAVARKCCGLPLALDLIGETMSCKKTTQEWHHAIEVLTSNVPDLSNIKDKILPLLKYSYDSLKEEQIKSGSLYCASLPENHRIDKEILIVEQLNEMDELQLQPTIVGQETMLDEAWNHLLEDEVGIMGLFGMGGVGKTTLLTQIHNKFSKDRRGFEYVIWVVVSKELHIEKIQDEIAQNVGIGGEEWNRKGTRQKTKKLYNFLKTKKFVLFLDDIWEKVELNLIGVPFPTKENKCKVAFTTRSQEICTRMGVEDPMKVQCLAEHEAFDLFQKKVGKITLGSDPEIPRLARIVAKKCCGLPLALNVIGETMSSKRTIYGWRHAIEVLTSNAAEFSDMEDKILHLLKYSYDDIKDEQVRSCLLYCALYPEDAKIQKENLIEYWSCEWVNYRREGIERAENKGYETISSLVRVSLLMEGVNQNGIEIVYMHDVVREMALWIASDLGKQKEAFIVRASVGLCAMPKIENWSVVKRMSLMDNEIRQLVGSPECTELTTLLLQRTELENISSEFFKFMPKLVILDLSGNYGLEFLDGIWNLDSLKYLNLSFTDIRQLPKGLPWGLIHLDLEETNNLSNIAGISRLYYLKVLKLSGSRIPWNLNTVKELERLEHLEILTTTTDGLPGSEQFLRSHRLTSCTRYLDYSNLESSEISLPVTMDKLRDFRIRRCSISEIKMGMIYSLIDVRIVDCQCLREMTFLMYVPNLKRLVVRNAKKLEEVINKEKASDGEESGFAPFEKLFYLRLERAPELKNIYCSPLPVPCLKKIEVIECPNLKKLPLDSRSNNEVIIRYGEREWIESVEWEDDAIKTHFLASCEQI